MVSKEATGVDLRVEWDGDDNEWNFNLSLRGSRWKTIAQVSARHNDLADVLATLSFISDRIIRHIEKQEELLSIVTPADDPENHPEQIDE